MLFRSAALRGADALGAGALRLGMVLAEAACVDGPGWAAGAGLGAGFGAGAGAGIAAGAGAGGASLGAGAVIGELGTSNALGVVNGVKDKELLEMRYVPGSVEVKEGDMVFTTGQDGIYPPGLKLGEVIEVRSGSATTAQTIYIKPSSGISSMQEVVVLLYEAPQRPKFEQAVPNAVKDDKKGKGKK